jgi:hypothetical protein
MRVTTVVFAGLAAVVTGAVNLSSNGAGATVAFFLPLVADLMRVALVIPTALAVAVLLCALNMSTRFAGATVAVICPLVANLMREAYIVLTALAAVDLGAVHLPSRLAGACVAVIAPFAPNLVPVAVMVAAGLAAAEVVGALRFAAGETGAGVAVLLPPISHLVYVASITVTPSIVVTGGAAVLVLSLGGLTPGLPIGRLVLGALLKSVTLIPEKPWCQRGTADMCKSYVNGNWHVFSLTVWHSIGAGARRLNVDAGDRLGSIPAVRPTSRMRKTQAGAEGAMAAGPRAVVDWPGESGVVSLYRRQNTTGLIGTPP